jgi:hypothetical protein
LVARALTESGDMLLLMIFVISLLTLIFSTLMYAVEQGDLDGALGYYVREGEPGTNDDGTPRRSPFDSVPSGFWWAIVTLVTIGYGDDYPITPIGKVIAGVLMIAGARCAPRAVLCCAVRASRLAAAAAAAAVRALAAAARPPPKKKTSFPARRPALPRAAHLGDWLQLS